MKFFTVHEPPEQHISTLERSDRIEFVKEGIAWPAFFFPVIWLLFHRMWIVLALFVAGFLVITGGLYALGTNEYVINIISAFISLGFAFEANNIRRWVLSRQGYRMVATVSGNSSEECELKFFSTWIDESGAESDLERTAEKVGGYSAGLTESGSKPVSARLTGNYPTVLGDIKG